MRWLGWFYAVSQLGCVGAFLLWNYRAASNVEAIGQRRLRLTPRDAVLGWFIPPLNLVHPYRALKAIYRASAPRGMSDEETRKTSLLFPVWWSAWLASCAFEALAMSAWQSEDSDRNLGAPTWDLVAVPFSLAAAACAIAIIWSIELRQEASARAPDPAEEEEEEPREEVAEEREPAPSAAPDAWAKWERSEEPRRLEMHRTWAWLATLGVALTQALNSGLTLLGAVVATQTPSSPLATFHASEAMIYGAVRLLWWLTAPFALAFSAAMFLTWLHGATNTARALSPRPLRITAASAILAWFVPLMNFARPYEIVRAVYRASKTAEAVRGDLIAVVPALLPLWWLSWLGMLAFELMHALLVQSGASWTAAVVSNLIAFGLSCVSAICVIAVLWSIQLRQESRARTAPLQKHSAARRAAPDDDDDDDV